MQRTISFRYGLGKTRSDYLNFVSSLAARYNLSHKSTTEKVKQFFTEEDIPMAEQHFWSAPKELKKLKKRGAIPLPAARIAALTKSVAIQVCIYGRDDDTLQLAISASDENDYPALSINVWLDRELNLPGGFFTLTGTDEIVFNEILKEVHEFRFPVPDDT